MDVEYEDYGDSDYYDSDDDRTSDMDEEHVAAVVSPPRVSKKSFRVSTFSIDLSL